jgi:hypothetical protein
MEYKVRCISAFYADPHRTFALSRIFVPGDNHCRRTGGGHSQAFVHRCHSEGFFYLRRCQMFPYVPASTISRSIGVCFNGFRKTLKQMSYPKANNSDSPFFPKTYPTSQRGGEVGKGNPNHISWAIFCLFHLAERQCWCFVTFEISSVRIYGVGPNADVFSMGWAVHLLYGCHL